MTLWRQPAILATSAKENAMIRSVIYREFLENAVIISLILAVDYCLSGPFWTSIHVIIK